MFTVQTFDHESNTWVDHPRGRFDTRRQAKQFADFVGGRVVRRK